MERRTPGYSSTATGATRPFIPGWTTTESLGQDYFPDLNTVAVGDENTPITGMIRHYSSLLCFKSDSAWAIRYGIITLADGSLTPAFYTAPTNRAIGNAAPGQVRLILNSPRTLHGGDLFEWKNNGAYSANLTADERQAKRISDRIYATLGSFRFSDCFCWDDNDRQEYYSARGGRALVRTMRRTHGTAMRALTHDAWRT